MVADSGASDGDRQWLGARKVWRVRGALIGFAGEYEAIETFLDWWRAGQYAPPPPFKKGHALVLTEGGLLLYAGSANPVTATGDRDAIGSGGKAAMAAYEAMGWQNPRRAVQIACRHDAGSRPPVRLYKL